ncbi:hypothetical protein [Anaerophaga thermohalophila]|jgi:hypothetical protein|uniref:hypothetical protein n=1 Tax=Anaerophaga thermohalophila TaxID=177400 RepID=UPI0003122CE4|nr:hypothetical protein [Anaerophaga thermohalophila]
MFISITQILLSWYFLFDYFICFFDETNPDSRAEFHQALKKKRVLRFDYFPGSTALFTKKSVTDRLLLKVLCKSPCLLQPEEPHPGMYKKFISLVAAIRPTNQIN